MRLVTTQTGYHIVPLTMHMIYYCFNSVVCNICREYLLNSHSKHFFVVVVSLLILLLFLFHPKLYFIVVERYSIYWELNANGKWAALRCFSDFCRIISRFASCIASHNLACDIIWRIKSSTAGSEFKSSKSPKRSFDWIANWSSSVWTVPWLLALLSNVAARNEI